MIASTRFNTQRISKRDKKLLFERLKEVLNRKTNFRKKEKDLSLKLIKANCSSVTVAPSDIRFKLKLGKLKGGVVTLSYGQEEDKFVISEVIKNHPHCMENDDNIQEFCMGYYPNWITASRKSLPKGIGILFTYFVYEPSNEYA